MDGWVGGWAVMAGGGGGGWVSMCRRVKRLGWVGGLKGLLT